MKTLRCSTGTFDNGGLVKIETGGGYRVEERAIKLFSLCLSKSFGPPLLIEEATVLLGDKEASKKQAKMLAKLSVLAMNDRVFVENFGFYRIEERAGDCVLIWQDEGKYRHETIEQIIQNEIDSGALSGPNEKETEERRVELQEVSTIELDEPDGTPC